MDAVMVWMLCSFGSRLFIYTPADIINHSLHYFKVVIITITKAYLDNRLYGAGDLFTIMLVYSRWRALEVFLR